MWLVGVYIVNKKTCLIVTFPWQKLYTYPESPPAAKGLIAAQYSGKSVTMISEPPKFVMGTTNKTPEFLAKFPLGKVRTNMQMH